MLLVIKVMKAVVEMKEILIRSKMVVWSRIQLVLENVRDQIMARENLGKLATRTQQEQIPRR